MTSPLLTQASRVSRVITPDATPAPPLKTGFKSLLQSLKFKKEKCIGSQRLSQNTDSHFPRFLPSLLS